MKKILFLLLVIFCTYKTCAQVVEQFDNDSFTNTWQGTTELFSIENNELKLSYNPNEINATQAYLSTASSAFDNATWEISITINTTTSSANYVRYYLTSTHHNLSAPLSGYFVMVGNTNDEICLYKQIGTSTTKIIDGTDKRVDFPSLQIQLQVERSAQGEWVLRSKVNGEQEYSTEGTTTDNDILGSNYSGIFVGYSKSNIGKYAFDNIRITGTPHIDNTPPHITDYFASSAQSLQVIFSEPINTQTPQINSAENCLIETIAIDELTYLFRFEEPFSEGKEHRFTLCGITDMSGNSLQDSIIGIYIPARKDVVFSELLPDPDPAVFLPKAKFLELYNRTPHTLRTKNWSIDIGKNSYPIPDTTILPHTHLIVCAAKDTALFQPYGRTIGIASLNQMLVSEAQLSVVSSTGSHLDFVAYSDSWHSSSYKRDGGWSLERIDCENLSNIGNWESSVSQTGGTPGTHNSVARKNSDTLIPKLSAVAIDAPDTIQLYFNKEMMLHTATNSSNYYLYDSPPLSITPHSAANTSYTICIATPLELGSIDTLTIQGLYDISGHRLPITRIAVALPEAPSAYNEVVINEILFNSKIDDGEYIELYNPTTYTWNLSHLYFTLRKDDALQKATPLSTHNQYLLPNAYIAICKNVSSVKEQFHTTPNAFFKEVNLPQLPNDKGTAVILLKNGTIIDEFSYSSKMHHPYIKNEQNVALERINPHLPTNSDEAWFSASSNVGYGTPGYKNSQYNELNGEDSSEQHFSLIHKSFSPNNDGHNDVLQIYYNLPYNGATATIQVFTASGIPVVKIYNNELLSTEGTLLWDGRTASGTLCSVGVYVLYIEHTTLQGKMHKQKLTFSITTN